MSISAEEAIVNSVELVLETVILLPPVIVISSFVFPESVRPSNLIAVVPDGTNKSYFVSVDENVICPSLFLVTVAFVPPTNLTVSSVPDPEASNNKLGLLFEPETCCAFNR